MNLPTASVQPPPGWSDLQRWNRIGYLIIVLGVGGFFLWAALAPLSSAVVSQGIVKVDSSRKKIQHVEGGTVKEILVKDGDRVRTGDVLVRLDETRAGASHGVVQMAYETALAHQARLSAERDGRATITFPKELAKRASDPKIAEIIKAQNAMFGTRKQSILGQLNILDRQVDQLKEQVEGLAAQRQAKEQQLKLLRDELAGLQHLIEKGMVEKTKLRNIEREIANLDGGRASNVSEIAAIRASMSEKELEKFQIRKRFQEEIAADLRKNQTEMFDYLERSTATRYTLDQTELRAPVDGTVVGLRVHTAGGVVSPSEVLMEVVPHRDRLIVEGKVAPDNIDRLSIGLPTRVKIMAFNQRTTPELEGKVSYVSADAIQDEKTGQTYFTLRVEVPEAQLKRLENHQIQPGMLADIFVRTGERTFLDYLLKPITESFQRAWRER